MHHSKIQGRKQIKGMILIADDLKENLRILSSVLTEEGYQVRAALNGKIALESALSNPPDLILMDVIMPVMDGLEACRLLKTDPRTKDVPVIFVSAASDVSSMVTGFQAGAVDYIRKPFEVEEILIRVNTHLTIQGLQKDLISSNERLQTLSKHHEDMKRLVLHDIKGPLHAIMNIPDAIIRNSNQTEKETQKLAQIKDAGRRILRTIEYHEYLTRLEFNTYHCVLKPIDLVSVINKVRADLEQELISNNICFKIMVDNRPIIPDEAFFINGDEVLCLTTIGNLSKNAVEASSNGDTVTVFLEHGETDNLVIHNKAVVPENIRDTFFDKYSTFGKQKGTGLGTYSAKLAVKKLGGSISMTTSEISGTSIAIKFPKKSQS